MTAPSSDRRQKYLGEKGLIALITFLSAFVPLSTDLYLPALPGMALYFDVSADLANLTLILFFVFFAAGTLCWGPLSDKYGRKPVLLAGLAIYTAASLGCAASSEIDQLIASRIFQAIGGSGAFAVATAMIKDVYDSSRREPILAMVQSMVLISPVAAPVLGALLLKFISWRGVFWTLALIALLALAGGAALQETMEERNRSSGSVLRAMGGLYKVARNPGFSSLLALFSLPSVSAMAFIAASSYIYINGFGLSPQVYSYYFAINAFGMISGPMLYMRISRRYHRRSIIIASFAAVSVSGLLVSSFGGLRPWMLAAALLPATISASCVRTPGTNLMLEQQRGDTGSAAALMSCFGILMGSFGMTIISLSWSDPILVLGMMNVLIGLASGALWLQISKKPYVIQVPERYIAAAGRQV
jgi:DHA1 family bicyclomycin/chloramphenicol resistance-like MFS transporter